MKKNDFKKLGVTVRPATEKDRRCARTNYQKNANFIIVLPNGDEYFAMNGNYREIRAVLAN